MRLLCAISKTGVKTLPLLTFLLFLAIQPRNWLITFASSQELAQSQDTRKDKASALLNLKGSSEPDITLLRGIQEIQSIQGIFKDAGWIFYPDGKFIFIPSQVNSPRAKLPPISGTYTQFEDRLEFQAQQQSSKFRVSLDGFIRQDGEHSVLDAIYTNSSWQDPRQIARVTQPSLTQQPPGTVKQPAIEQTPVSQPQPNSKPLPSEIKIPGLESIQFRSSRVFDIVFEGKTEAGTFNTLPGILYVTPGKDAEPPSNIDLLVDPKSLVTNGGFRLSTGEVSDSGIQIQGNNSQIQIEFKPSEKMRQLNWWTLPVGKFTSSEPLPVMGETATVTLSIQGDQVTGEIRARGRAMSGDEHPSTYEAKITGRVQKSQLTEQLRTALQASGFNGRWSTSSEDTEKAFGQIELQQIGQQVSGKFKGQGGGTIEGRVVTQNRVNFTWKNNQQIQGRGFLRVIGGTLVGLWSTQDPKTNNPLVATWQLPSSLSTQTLSPLDIRELRQLGHHLTGEGRCEQAVALLDQVFTFYRSEREKPTATLQDQMNSALSESFSLGFASIPCSFQLGDYDRQLVDLAHYLDIQDSFRPEKWVGSFFRQDMASLAEVLKSNSKRLAIFQEGFGGVRKTVSDSRFIGRIGINLEQDEKTHALVIRKVLTGESAEKAGILPEDILVKINGYSTQGMNVDQASEKLRGTPNTPVTVTVRRGEREIDFKLVRGQVEVYPAARQPEFIQALTFLIDYLANARTRLQMQQAELTNTETKITQGQADPIEAWIALTGNLKNQKTQIDTETDNIIARGRILFKKQTSLLQDYDAILQAVPKTCGQASDVNVNKQRELEKRIDFTLENSRDLTLVEKTLFKATLSLAYSLTGLSVELDCEHNKLVRTDAKKLFDEHKQQITEIANRLDRDIERWRIKLVDDADKIDALEKGQPFFQKLIPLLVELGDEKGALVASEKSRARAFADLLAARLSTNSAQANAESPTLEQIQQIAKTQAATLVQYSIVENPDKEPELFIWVVQPTGEVNLKRVSLKFLEQRKSYLELRVEQRQKPTPLGVFIDETRSVILDQLENSQENDPTPYLQQLHQLLIQPISELLPSDPNAHIIFIPQKELFLVPFPALLDANGKYLIQKHTILTAPSIQALDSTHRLRQQNAGASKQNLVVGNPIYAPELKRENQLPDLKGWEQGAKDIAAQLNTQAIIGRDATKATILNLLPQARIIHLATHSKFDEEQPLKSWIALTPEGSDVNGELTVQDLLALYAPPKGSPLHAELIVLAACETGKGHITGDGVNGLSRSLIAAGIPSAVVSLWRVYAIPTIFLMKEFYKDLPSGKAQALRQAMLATMKEYPNRVGTWAGFTLIGEAE